MLFGAAMRSLIADTTAVIAWSCESTPRTRMIRASIAGRREQRSRSGMTATMA
jgi:hypothetical protein